MARAPSSRVRERAPELRFAPLTPGRLRDLERLFGPRGACAGCWCMWWKTTRAEFDAGRGEGNREAMRRQVRAGVVPGILAYAGDDPVGWCALEPRSAYPRLARSRTLAPVDGAPVWSVTCFYVSRAWRGRGITGALLRAAAGHARRAGATALEGYPIAPRGETADAWLYTGLRTTFAREGFEEVARRSPTRPVMRMALGPRRKGRKGRAAGEDRAAGAAGEARPARTARPPRRAPAARARAPGRSRARNAPTPRSASRRGR
jgi:GNAT superfamily N-acetyltransferase